MKSPNHLFVKAQLGFSLVEMAVVLVILGFVIAALLLPLQAQREINFRTQTENQLEIARKAILGFAQSRGRLPCPATAASNGIEVFIGNNCDPDGRFLPAATLGIQPVNANGFAVDAWNNPIRYAVTQADNLNGVAATPSSGYGIKGIADFTSSTELIDIGISRLNPDNSPALDANLIVCEGSLNCPATYLVNNAVAVIFSTGSNGTLPDAEVGGDEIANKTATTTFYSRVPTATGSLEGEFDDLIVWISPYVLYNAMIEAGQLH